MAEPAPDIVERALRSAASEVRYPPTPTLGPAVAARLRWEGEARRTPRPPFPGVALWTRRRFLVALVATLLLLAAAVGAARVLTVGAVQIRVVPSVPPTPGGERTPSLGPPISLDDARGKVRFPVRYPQDLGPPDEVHVVGTTFVRRVVLLAWRPDAGRPGIEGTPWGAVLMELPSERGVFAYKDLAAQNRVEPVSVGGSDGVWVRGRHVLVLVTDGGELHVPVLGNVLLWDRGGVTYRLETALGRAAAIRLAGSIP